IGQPRFFLDDEAPRAAHQLGREQAATPAPLAIAAADGHPAQSTRGRAALEDEAIEAEPRELAHARASQAAHGSRQIAAALGLDEVGRGRGADEDDRRARHAEPELYLGTHGDPLHVGAERAQQRARVLVATVVADARTEETRRDAEPDLFAL